MPKKLTEAKVLKKLNITDFQHQTKDSIITLASIIDKVDPEVAKKALEQFPEFTGAMRQAFTDQKQLLDESLKNNAESVRSYYETCDAIITTCQKELEKDVWSFEQRCYFIEQMKEILYLKGEMDSKNKTFIGHINTLLAVVIGGALGAALTAVGTNLKVNPNATK